MKIKFSNSQSLFGYDFEQISLTMVKLSHEEIKKNTSGFRVVNDEKQDLYIFDDFTVAYECGDGYIIYTNDTNIYNVFGIYNKEGYFYSQTVSIGYDVENGILIKSGQGKEFAQPEQIEWLDENGIFNYKVVENQMVEISAEEKAILLKEKQKEDAEKAEEEKKERFEQTKKDKLIELSDACREAIYAGVVVDSKHYTYDLTDQNDIKNGVEMASKTGLDVPYHANGESCTLYAPEEIIKIYVAEETNLTHHTTYHNQLKLFVGTLTTIEEVEAVEYGQELTGEYLDTYNMIMEQAEKIINAFISGGIAQ